MFKRIMSILISATTVAGFIPHIPAKADESGTQSYPYTLFASSSEDGAITVNAKNFCVNGNVATNGTIVSSDNININGTRTEQAEESMIYILDKIDTSYFSGSNIDEHEDDYRLEELNININNPTEVYGEATLTGNININSALKALEDVNLYGEVKNTNDSLIFSKYGDIVIESQNVNLNGLVYAPFGNVTISAQNLNLNNVVIIAQSIVLTCPNVNANNSSSMSSFVGNESEPLNIPYDEWGYMKDENGNDFPDFFEDINNWSQLKDSDGDKLPDCVELFIGSETLNIDTDNDKLDDYYEVFVLFTDPTLEDSDENGISDYDEDFDEDSLVNGQEYLLETDPWNNDSDNDDISDGDEVNTYHTDPMNKDTDNDRLEDSDEFLFNTDPNNPDTNGNGILDGDEKFPQTFSYIVENEDCAVEEVIISMNGTGNIQKNTSIESIMNKDMICSDVVGLVGEPFEIETESQFDNATLSFKINRSKLGDTDLDDLMFLWYDEKNYEFVELETFYDDIKSIVSINTTHFSRYMIVDKNMWFEAWSEDLNQISDSHEKSACYFVLAVDCSGSMDRNDPTTIIIPNSPPYKPVNMCERHKAVSNFASSLDYDDKAAIVTFEDSANIVCEMTNNESDLYWASTGFYNGGGTNFDAAISKSVEILNNNPSATRKKIILLTDGESSISNTILQEAIDSHIKIYTIGLGNSSDGILKRIAQETGGEFFKAYTAQELVSIYTNNGFDNDFDTTDTDGDGLYDVVETAGIRIQNGNKLFNNPQNGLIFTDPTNPDTDYDGLKDGEEIDSTLRYKKTYWCSPEIDSPNNRSYYFVMKSDPNKKDSDDDGIIDLYDEEPLDISKDPLSPTNVEYVQYINIPSDRAKQPDFIVSIVKSKLYDDKIFFAYGEGVPNTGGFLVTDDLIDYLNDLEDDYNDHFFAFLATKDQSAAHAAKLETDQLVPRYFDYGSIEYYGCWAYNFNAEKELLDRYSKVVNKAMQAYTVYFTISNIYQARMLAVEQKSLTLSESEYASTAKAVTSGSTNLNVYGIDVENLNFSKTVSGHINRPYQESKLLIKEIMDSKTPIPDPQGTNALYWEVDGTFNKSSGHYELLIDPASNTVWHFVYISR